MRKRHPNEKSRLHAAPFGITPARIKTSSFIYYTYIIHICQVVYSKNPLNILSRLYHRATVLIINPVNLSMMAVYERS